MNYALTEHLKTIPLLKYLYNRAVKRPNPAGFDLTRRRTDECVELHEHCLCQHCQPCPLRSPMWEQKTSRNPDCSYIRILRPERSLHCSQLQRCWVGPRPCTLTLKPSTISNNLSLGLKYPTFPTCHLDSAEVEDSVSVDKCHPHHPKE